LTYGLVSMLKNTITQEQMIITEWYVLDTGTAEWTFNHISKGYNYNIEDMTVQPPAVCPLQKKAWANEIWWPRKAHLINGKVINKEQL